MSSQFRSNINEAFDNTLKGLVASQARDTVESMLKTDATIRSIKKTIIDELDDVIEIRVQNLVKARVNETLAKVALRAKIALAKELSPARTVIVQELEDHIESRDRNFQNFDALFENACADYNEDSLDTKSPLTELLNIAHSLNDEDHRMLKQVVKDVKDVLPSEALVKQLEEELAELEEEDRMDEGVKL